MTTSTSPTSSGSSAEVTSSNSMTWATSSALGRSPPAAAGRPRAGAGAASPSPRARHGPEELAGALLGLRAAAASGSAARRASDCSITVRCGNRLNCWKTIPIRCRTAETSTPLRVISSPSKKIRPESIGSSRLTQRSRVLLPLPLGPMMTTTSPGSDLEVDAVEHEVVAEALAHVLEPDDRADLSVLRGGQVGVGGAGRAVAVPPVTEAGSARSTEKEACLGFHRFCAGRRRSPARYMVSSRGRNWFACGSVAACGRRARRRA